MSGRLPKNRAPTHPGFMILDFLEDLGMTQTEFAEAIGISRVRLNEVVHGKRAMTPSTALRLERAVGKPAYWWLGLQQDYDLWHALHGPEMDDIETVRPLLHST